MPVQSPDFLNEFAASVLPGHMGLVVEVSEPDRMVGSFTVGQQHMAPNGFLHAGSVVTLADSLCGYATVNNLPDGAVGFTTVELKSNFLGTARSGVVRSTATPVHRGRMTQVWDAVVVSEESGKTMALFRCTQMILWPKG